MLACGLTATLRFSHATEPAVNRRFAGPGTTWSTRPRFNARAARRAGGGALDSSWGLGMSEEELLPLPGEEELYDLWLDTQTRAVELIDKMDLTDEDVRRINERWSLLHPGHAMGDLTSYIETIRNVRRLASFARPGEILVSFKELGARLRQKGDA